MHYIWCVVLDTVIVIIAGCCINLCTDQSVSSTARLELPRPVTYVDRRLMEYLDILLLLAASGVHVYRHLINPV